MKMYEGLQRWLAQEGDAEFELEFEAIEAAMGRMLPKNARHPHFWDNRFDRFYGQGIKRAIQEAGFRAELIRGARRVRFTRR